MKLFDTAMDVVSQGGVRRGAFASYLDIDHPDIEEFLQIKSIGSPIQNLFTGVCIPDYWMQEMIDGDDDKREIWAKVLESRQQKGLPYLFFTDNVNRNKPEIYKKLGLSINSSNLCSEIALPSTENESFICCLASMNLELYDEWKDTNAVRLAIYFLDAVLSEFIEKTEGNLFLKSARSFAIRHRALGLGVLGWHSYLQKNMIPFGSLQARFKTTEIFGHIKTNAEKASFDLGQEYGCAPIFNEVDIDSRDNILIKRNTTLMAIAPTTSSSAILGQVSPGIEPYSSNYYKAGLAKGNFMRKNKYLEKIFEERGYNTEDTWRSIMNNYGSVQHLSSDILSDDEKEVFKTFKETSQLDIILQAALRQKYIDQSQSLNVNTPSEIPVKEVNQLFITAWKEGVKTLYYQRSSSVSKELLTNIVSCSGCES
jgi:ribonucleoside-diphosphate reductase alpha chain